MEVTLDKRYPVAASVEQAWAVLCDIRAVAGCMPGAAITEQIDATHYKGTVKTKIGPASMQFGGDIEVLAMDPAARSMQMVGKGADKSGSSASMDLTAHLEPGDSPGTSVLVGQAKVLVNGKLAQFGSRLLVPVSDAMLAQFADKFRVAAAAVPVAEVPPTAVADPVVASIADAAVPPNPAGDPIPASVSVGGSRVDGSEEVSVARPMSSPAPSPAPSPVAEASAAAPNELNALGLMWTVIKGWLAGLFGRRA